MMRSGRRCLCIDDDPQISETIALRLNQYEVNVLRAFHGMHGFWLAMTNRPDLIITDMKMPQGAGEYVVDCLRHNSDTRDIPVIVLTGQRDPQLESRMRQLGVDEFFTKPVHFEQLREAIVKYIPLKERDWGEVGAWPSRPDASRASRGNRHFEQGADKVRENHSGLVDRRRSGSTPS